MLNHLVRSRSQLGNALSSRSNSPSSTGWQWRNRLSREVHNKPLIAPAESGVRSPKMARLEAALFVAERALSLNKLTQMATLADVGEAQSLIERLNDHYENSNSAFRIEQVAAGFKLLTLPHLAKWLDRVHDRQPYMKLSPPAMETLSIIAYRQPCTRADVEAVRGVQAAEMIKQLMEKGLVRIVGEDDSLGRPYLYGTTKLFLESFGFSKLSELPMAEELVKQEEDETESSEEDSTELDTDDAVSEAAE